VRPKAAASADADLLHADVLRAGENAAALRAVLAQHAPDALLLTALLRRAVPLRLLELLQVPPWTDDSRVQAGVVLNPRATVPLSLRVLPALLWRHLAEVSRAPHVVGPVRVRAEALLRDKVGDLRLGDRVALAKIATPPVVPLLLADAERRVAEACLTNPRLREEDLVNAIRQEAVTRALLEAVADSTRWSANYSVRLAVVLQPRTPLPIALAQVSALVPRDLRRLAEAPVAPLLQIAASRLLEAGP
jgi:hypothetical protein